MQICVIEYQIISDSEDLIWRFENENKLQNYFEKFPKKLRYQQKYLNLFEKCLVQKKYFPNKSTIFEKFSKFWFKKSRKTS